LFRKKITFFEKNLRDALDELSLGTESRAGAEMSGTWRRAASVKKTLQAADSFQREVPLDTDRRIMNIIFYTINEIA
jgi:hypothetical protein